MDPIKVTGVAEWKEPKNPQDICKYLGFCNFYRRFIKGFSKIAKPLNDLLKKGAKWAWGKAEKEAFKKIRNRITEEPVLVQPDQNKQFEVEVDTSNFTMGAILMQRDEKGQLRPIASAPRRTTTYMAKNYGRSAKCSGLGDTSSNKRSTRLSSALTTPTYSSGKIQEITIEEWCDGMWNLWNTTLNYNTSLEGRTVGQMPYPDAQITIKGKMTTNS